MRSKNKVKRRSSSQRARAREVAAGRRHGGALVAASAGRGTPRPPARQGGPARRLRQGGLHKWRPRAHTAPRRAPPRDQWSALSVCLRFFTVSRGALHYSCRGTDRWRQRRPPRLPALHLSHPSERQHAARSRGAAGRRCGAVRARARHESKEAREVARRSLRAPIQGAARDLCGGRKGEQASPERESVQCVAAPSAAESRRTLRCAHSGRCVRRARQPASCHARSATHALHRHQQPVVSESCVVL